MEYLKKSEDTFKAGEKLIEHKLHTPSVHCFYYSCLQYMSKIVYNDLKYNNQQLENYKNKYNNNNNIKNIHGTHEILFNIINEKIVIHKEKREYRKLFHRLKNLRVKADYKISFITENEVENIKRDSKLLLKLLQKTAKLWEQERT